MKTRPSFTLLAVALLIGFAWLGTGCGGGGGGGGGSPTEPLPPIAPPSGVTFTADSAPTSNSIYLSAGSGGSASVFVLDVEAQNVSDLYGVTFVLNYPNNLLGYRKGGTTEGSFLNGSYRTKLIVKQLTPGELTVGISRINEVPGAEGSGLLLSLEFATKSGGTGSMTLSEHEAVDSYGEAQNGVDWIGGSVSVQAN